MPASCCLLSETSTDKWQESVINLVDHRKWQGRDLPFDTEFLRVVESFLW